MSGAIGNIFGGKTEKQKVVDTTPSEFQALRGPFADVVRQLFGTKGGDPLQGIPSFEGPLAAPISPGEQQALSSVAGLANDPARQQLLQDTLSGKYTQQGNPFTQQAIEAAQRPTLEAYEQLLGRVLPGQFTAAGQQVQPGQSSPFSTAAAIESRGLANALADISTSISFASHEAERGRQQEAITLSQHEVDTSIKNLQAQALPRLIQDLGIERGLQEFQGRLDALLGLLSILSGGTLQQQQVTGKSETKPDIFGSLFPGGLTSAGSVFS